MRAYNHDISLETKIKVFALALTGSNLNAWYPHNRMLFLKMKSIEAPFLSGSLTNRLYKTLFYSMARNTKSETEHGTPFHQTIDILEVYQHLSKI